MRLDLFVLLTIVSFFSPPPTGTDVKEAQVICVSTGTKCINGEYMSDRGLALNDCHAEIIARRSLIRYLYSQLEFFLRSVDSRPESSSGSPNTDLHCLTRCLNVHLSVTRH